MADKVQKLRIGQLVEIEGRLYDVVPDKQGGATLEPAITVSAEELVRRSGGRPMTPGEFERFFGHLPSDSEG